jgi:hypothetical protein
MFNDSLDNLFGGDTGPVRSEPVRPAPSYKPATERFAEGCTKCRGTGRFVSYSGRVLGECFACKGKGKKTFKTSADVRAKARNGAAERKERIQLQGIEAFKAEHQAAYEWLVATAPRWDLAASLLAGLHRFGSLTEKQLAVVAKGIERDAARAAERAEQAAQAPTVNDAGIDRLKAAFDSAVAYAAAKGLKMKTPKITIGCAVISPAGNASKNAGALYVKERGTYLGKIAGGKFYATRDCSAERSAEILVFVADPKAAAEAYGQTTGVCCVCNATLTNGESKALGIGPICRTKMGW